MEYFWLIVLVPVTIGLHWLAARAGAGGCVVSVALCAATGLAVVLVWSAAVQHVFGQEAGAYMGLAALFGVTPAIVVLFPMIGVVLRGIASLITTGAVALRRFELGAGAVVIIAAFYFLLRDSEVSILEFAIMTAPVLAGWIVYVLVIFSDGESGSQQTVVTSLSPSERADLDTPDKDR